MSNLSRRNIFFALFFVLAFLMAFFAIRELYTSTSNREYYSHIALIPLISMYFLYQKREILFSAPGSLNLRRPGKDDHPGMGKAAGVALILIGVLIYAAGLAYQSGFNRNDFASITAASSVILLNGAFLAVYGLQVFKVALFPMLFLVFAIPLPSPIMSGLIGFLQAGSTEFADLLFAASGVPFVREGTVFHLSGMSVDVAPECSGIRSGMAIFITSLLAGQLFLNTWWRKVILLVVAVPMTMFKNGIRVVALTLLGNYVDPRILESSLHKQGGIPFFVVALLLMAPVLFFLMKSERKHES